MRCDVPANTVTAAGISLGDLVAATLFRLEDRWDAGWLLRAAYIRGDELTMLSDRSGQCCKW